MDQAVLPGPGDFRGGPQFAHEAPRRDPGLKMVASPCASSVPALLMTAFDQIRMLPVPDQTRLPVAAMLKVRTLRSLVPPLTVPVPAAVVTPAAVMAPPD